MRALLLAAAALALSVGAVRAESEMRENPFGVLEFLYWDHDWNDHQYPDEAAVRKAVRMMKEAGVGMVRIDILWQDVEPRQGDLDYGKYDRLLDILNENGIEVLALLDYCADWASPNGQWNTMPADHSRFLEYVTRTVERYKGKVRYWELWNEPDSPVYWQPQDGLKAYCGLLREVYAAIKKIDPGLTVLNGGLTYELCKVNQLYDNGGKGYFDILNIHMFETPHKPEESARRMNAYVEACARIMARNGDGAKKIWVTETGCPGLKRGVRAKNWWMGENPSEKLQARMVKETYKVLLARPEVEKVFWAFFRDTRSHWKDGTDYLGLVRNDFTAKAGYKAYKETFEAWQAGGKERKAK